MSRTNKGTRGNVAAAPKDRVMIAAARVGVHHASLRQIRQDILTGVGTDAVWYFDRMVERIAHDAKQRAIELSNHDRDLLLATLDNPPAPNAALIAAGQRYRR